MVRELDLFSDEDIYTLKKVNEYDFNIRDDQNCYEDIYNFCEKFLHTSDYGYEKSYLFIKHNEMGWSFIIDCIGDLSQTKYNEDKLLLVLSMLNNVMSVVHVHTHPGLNPMRIQRNKIDIESATYIKEKLRDTLDIIFNDELIITKFGCITLFSNNYILKTKEYDFLDDEEISCF